MKNYLEKAVAVSAQMVDKHANRKGRFHSNMWHYYMGRFSAFRESLQHLSSNKVEEKMFY